MSSLAKLTDLFQEGVVVALKTPAPVDVAVDPPVVWINKLSPFEVEQSNHEGRIARARIMLAIAEIGTPEYDLFRANAANLKPGALIEGLLEAQGNEHLVKVIRELHSDPEWKPRLETLEWSGDQLEGKADDDPEVAVVTKILSEYQAEMDLRRGRLAAQLRSELESLTDEDLRERHRESYIDQRGMAAFSREQQQVQVFYALRRCEGVRDNERWHHGACDHSQRWLEDSTQVRSLPESLLAQVRTAYEELNMAPDVARFSDALGSSSAPPEPSNTQEDSADSGPEVTSDELVGTSSPQ